MKEVRFKGGPVQKEYWFDNCSAVTFSDEVKKHFDQSKPDPEIGVLAVIADRDHKGHTRVFYIESRDDMRRIMNWGDQITWKFCERKDLLDENYVWLK